MLKSKKTLTPGAFGVGKTTDTRNIWGRQVCHVCVCVGEGEGMWEGEREKGWTTCFASLPVHCSVWLLLELVCK